MMDNNQSLPPKEGQNGEKKPHHGKRRPNRHGRRRPGGQEIRENKAVDAAVVTDASANTSQAAAEGGDTRANPARNQNNRHPNRNRGNGGKPERATQGAATDTSAETQRVDEKVTADKKTREDRAVGRPQRPKMPSPPKKASSLPQMDNLLIEDCPEEVADLAGAMTDTSELERILSYDIFAKEHHEIPDVIPEGKVVIAGIRFRTGGKTYFFDPGQLSCSVGSYAVVETARGLEFGEVCIGNRMVDSSLVVPPLRPVVRLATPEDLHQNELNHQREAEAFKLGKEKILEHGLDMKLVSVQYTFDNSKLLFYFTSDGRVDFRELVKDLAGIFHIRIELRQIGIRDEARMLGGLGACGRPLCCSTFLSDFGQVSMKMAKEQNLTLNANKISGCCGRLMCCLRYEHETYAEALRELPNQGSFVYTPDGLGVVTDVLPLEGAVKVSLKNDSEAAPKKYKKQDISIPQRNRPAETSSAEDVAEPDSDD